MHPTLLHSGAAQDLLRDTFAIATTTVAISEVSLWFAKTPAGSGINDIAAVVSIGVLV